jgi:hypothetical protein
MNYKKIFRNKKVRLCLLGFLRFVPDKLMIKLQYRIKTGRSLNLVNPIRYTEKVQWYKLNYHHPLMPICSDKYTVRSYVEDKGYSRLLNELYAVYDDVNHIDFDKLPNSFAIKHTNGSGKNIFVTDKSVADLSQIKKEISDWLKKDSVNYGREWGYNDVKSQIVIEAIIPRDENNDLPDYKFFCFNGKVEFLYTMVDYVDDHDAGKCSFFDREFNKLPYARSEYKAIDRTIAKPSDFEEMLKVAEVLSKDFPHVRVDFYNVDGRIIFGELTFYNASGYTVFSPDEFDFIMGDKFRLPSVRL